MGTSLGAEQIMTPAGKDHTIGLLPVSPHRMNG